MSALALGALTYGKRDRSAGLVRSARPVHRGRGSLIDTADVYGDERSEEIIGRWPRAGQARGLLSARTLDQLNDNLAAVDQPLSEDETRLLDEVSQPDDARLPYGREGPGPARPPPGGGRF